MQRLHFVSRCLAVAAVPRSYGFDINGAVAYDGSLQMKQFTAQILTFLVTLAQGMEQEFSFGGCLLSQVAANLLGRNPTQQGVVKSTGLFCYSSEFLFPVDVVLAFVVTALIMPQLLAVFGKKYQLIPTFLDQYFGAWVGIDLIFVRLTNNAAGFGHLPL